MGRVACFVLCICLGTLSNAQDGPTDRIALIERSSVMCARMLADSMPMTAAQVDTLRAMAARSNGNTAMRMLQQALVISDSIQDLVREQYVLAALGTVYERSGRADDALRATRAADFLDDSLSSAAHAKAFEELRAQQEAERQQWEATSAMQDKERQTLRDALEQLRRRQQETYGVIGALVIILLIVMGLALIRTGHRKRQGRGQVAAEQIAPVVLPRRNMLRPTEPTAIPAQEAPTTVPDPVIDADDAVLLSLFRKRMPERLQALKEARSRGDHEKVLRVITSVRPQLMHHDAERFSERCTRLIAAGQTVLEEASRHDLEGLIADVERALGGPFSGK